ncbi:hypothetical protein LIER_04012 [Lithospermum erythrorhizon]|uniref:Uncharacterized protein n=1 Tax=Lithospermum erythrorhizon TaxID=34254 RepID=A0AAV3NWI1_LITER
MSSSSSSSLSLDHLQPSEQLYYVHCNICNTILAVSVPCTSLFKTVTVRCGHCTNLLPINMRDSLQLPPPNQLNFGHNLFPPPHNFLEQLSTTPMTTTLLKIQQQTSTNEFSLLARSIYSELPPRPQISNRTPEKKPRVPSAYNRFVKEEIQRIKAVNPDISHREAFSSAAKNWAHFPHIQFNLIPDQTVKKGNVFQQGGDHIVKDGYFTSANNSNNNVGYSPY